MTRILLLDPATPERLARMRDFLPDGWTIDATPTRDLGDQLKAIQGADLVIVSDVPMGEDLMTTPGLRAVHKWGVGYDGIALEAARRAGVRVMRTTGSNAITVAETTLGLILAVNRNIVRGHVGIREGGWPKGELAATSMKLSGGTVGIIGMGYIGKALARMLRGFGCKVLYSKRTPLAAEEEAEIGATFRPLDAMLAEADVITLNCDLNESTRNLIDRDKLALMKPDAILVNAARGGVLVEADLADAIREGRLRGAGIDVFSIEPIRQDNPLMGLDRVVLTPHIAAISADGFPASVKRMFENFQAVIDNRPFPREIDVLV
ncbi:2-hydroxyacid dehydrogenase [Paracoccus sp. TK19116]|uniref:2-hydroxyacid dehydrogenase n=1 Tax=Paracoccus albicereus TaxID=2922394 RepID=A0ABT1MUJ0_9RHOB|nr:2-hydroxyacid dehydrogenase [Paracoccus albicereus]MCQ0971136.1 2-hydroxyacid dehydrogenase [Paracoccus albicereus]